MQFPVALLERAKFFGKRKTMPAGKKLENPPQKRTFFE